MKNTPITVESLTHLASLDEYPIVKAALIELGKFGAKREAFAAEEHAIRARLATDTMSQGRADQNRLQALAQEAADHETDFARAEGRHRAVLQQARSEIAAQLQPVYRAALQKFDAALDRLFRDEAGDLQDLEALVERLGLVAGGGTFSADLLPDCAGRLQRFWAQLRDAARANGFL